MAITFYYAPRSSATRVHWALEELEIPYKKKRIRLDRGEQKAPEFLAVNPNGKVPALTDDGAHLFESCAIIIHLGEKYGRERGLWPEPGSPAAGEALSWTIWGTVQIVYYYIEYAVHGTDAFGVPKQKRNAEHAERMKHGYYRHLSILDTRLTGQPYTLGSAFTLVDVANAALIGEAEALAGLGCSEHVDVAAWLERCRERPAYGRVLEDESAD